MGSAMGFYTTVRYSVTYSITAMVVAHTMGLLRCQVIMFRETFSYKIKHKYIRPKLHVSHSLVLKKLNALNTTLSSVSFAKEATPFASIVVLKIAQHHGAKYFINSHLNF